MGTFECGTRYRTTGAGGTGRFNVVQLSGDWPQMGRQYGYLLKDQMGEFYDLASARLMAGGATYAGRNQGRILNINYSKQTVNN